MTVFGVVCARFCTLTAAVHTRQLATPALSRRSGASERHSHKAVCLLGKLGRFIGHAPQQTQQCGRRILGVSHCWCRTTVSGRCPFGPVSWVSTHPLGMLSCMVRALHFEMSSSQVLAGWQHEAASRVERHHREHTLMSVLSDEGSFEVTEWPLLGCCVVRHAIMLPHSDSSPPLSCLAAQTPPSPPSDCSHLPMWPPTRFLWPSSCSVCAVRVGWTGICCGECSGQSMPRGRRPGFHQRDGSRPGPTGPTSTRWPTAGSCRRRPPAVWGHAARHRSTLVSPRTHPELIGPRTRSRLVVLAGEVGGRWSMKRAWPKRGPVLNPPSCARELNLLGGSGGQHSWHVLLDVLLPRMWWRGR